MGRLLFRRGIRPASYCLGALQGLQIGGLLGKAGLVLGVSGGSYIAASRAYGREAATTAHTTSGCRISLWAPLNCD
jgi:hypothetical protein